jgi:hypothetical protein
MAEFHEFLNWLKVNRSRTYGSLGGRSSFSATFDQDNRQLVIKNSKDNQYPVPMKVIEQVFERYQNAAPSCVHKTSYYTDPAWVDCPARITAPGVAAVIKAWNILK